MGLSDKTRTRFGKRTPWYVVGTILVVVCFLFIFQDCIFCKLLPDDSDSVKAVRIFYYILFPSLFNVGWAFIQIAHMSLVPSLTVSRTRRDSLNNLRNTFTYVANIFVLVFALLLFIIVSEPRKQFEYLAYVVIGIGAFTSIFFLSGVNEPSLTKECHLKLSNIKSSIHLQSLIDPQDLAANAGIIQTKKDIPELEDKFVPEKNENGEGEGGEEENNLELSFDESENKVRRSIIGRGSLGERIMNWTEWFKERDFYIYGIVYMSARITVNVCSSMLQFYLVNVLQVAKEDVQKETPLELGLIPICMYSSSVLTSIFLTRICTFLGNKKYTYTLGLVFVLGAAGSLMVLTPEYKNLVYLSALALGFGQSTCLNTALNFISDVIGLRGTSGAFVFGAYSFTDKFSNGIILYLAMASDLFKNKDEMFLRVITAVIPASAAVLGWALVLAGSHGARALERKKCEERNSIRRG
eukprot:TRINITY_DN2851_c0_g2_i2.p1 TRINITY_DN2851_c0_g2~~TRINITY_DN2851_c0_g2_i2.p1  ORF type:complete len:468 (-),score=83.59 TRINITY_DN2851_c0_g2_i2:79-1482(-)